MTAKLLVLLALLGVASALFVVFLLASWDRPAPRNQ